MLFGHREGQGKGRPASLGAEPVCRFVDLLDKAVDREFSAAVADPGRHGRDHGAGDCSARGRRRAGDAGPVDAEAGVVEQDQARADHGGGVAVADAAMAAAGDDLVALLVLAMSEP